MRCIYCGKDGMDSDEHIVPLAMGNKKMVIKCVCKKCNDHLGEKVDAPLVNNPLVKMFRINSGLTERKGKSIKFFEGREIDVNTGIAFDMEGGKLKIAPCIKTTEDCTYRIVAESHKDAFNYFRKVMKRKGISDDEIENNLSEANLGYEKMMIPEFNKVVTMDYTQLALPAIKIAFEYSYWVFGETYLEDDIAKIFRKELNNAINEKNKNLHVSDELSKYINFPSYNLEIKDMLETYRKEQETSEEEVLHLIYIIQQRNSLFCVLDLFLNDYLVFVVRITDNADRYGKGLRYSIIRKDGQVYYADVPIHY